MKHLEPTTERAINNCVYLVIVSKGVCNFCCVNRYLKQNKRMFKNYQRKKINKLVSMSNILDRIHHWYINNSEGHRIWQGKQLFLSDFYQDVLSEFHSFNRLYKKKRIITYYSTSDSWFSMCKGLKCQYLQNYHYRKHSAFLSFKKFNDTQTNCAENYNDILSSEYSFISLLAILWYFAFKPYDKSENEWSSVVDSIINKLTEFTFTKKKQFPVCRQQPFPCNEWIAGSKRSLVLILIFRATCHNDDENECFIDCFNCNHRTHWKSVKSKHLLKMKLFFFFKKIASLTISSSFFAFSFWQFHSGHFLVSIHMQFNKVGKSVDYLR